jgi:glycosyltransferase involved in cell wall biosynthesis
MKIAMVTDSFYPTIGGSETAIKNLSLEFLKMGHQVKVYGLFEGVESPDARINVVYVSPKIQGLNLKVIGRYINLNKEIKRYRPDIINAHFLLKSGWAGVKAAKKNKIASIVTVRGKGVFYKHDSIKEALLFYIYRRMSLGADKILATSAEMADMVKKRWDKRAMPLSNGVDINHFLPDIQTELKRKLKLEDKKVILCARRLVPKNGIEYIIRAMHLILEKKGDVHLLLLAPRQREYKKLKELSEELNIGGRVAFLGEIEHDVLPEYYAIADLVVQPSIAEARSLSCLEAMASGKAIIATATGGLKELIKHKVNGYLIPPFEASTYQVGKINKKGVENLYRAVLELLDNQELREKIKNGARQTAEENSWEIIGDKTLEIYQQAINKNKAR